jgi:hypothetical protein
MAEQSLPELWKEAEDRFSRRTGKALKLNPAKTLEDLKKELESQPKEDVGKQVEAKQRAKEFGLKALKCLKLLGGIASQGASLVGLCALDLMKAANLILRFLAPQIYASTPSPCS